MVNFDRTQSAFIENTVRNMVQEPRTGKVLRVYEHLESGDEAQDIDPDTSNFEADVKVDGGSRHERLTPIASSSGSSIDVPRVGDAVMVEYLAGESRPPVITGYVHTTKDRPPVGKSGMSRKKLDSSDSPMGSGDVFTTEYTRYEEDPTDVNKNDLTPSEVFVQIAKRLDDEPDPSKEGDLPAKIEFYDSPGTDDAHVTVELNTVNGNSSSASWGMKFDIKSGTWQIVGPNGFGIESDGDGNFVWHHKDITFNEPSGPEGPLSL